MVYLPQTIVFFPKVTYEIMFSIVLFERGDSYGAELSRERVSVVTTASDRSPATVHFAFARRIAESSAGTRGSSDIFAQTVGFTSCRVPWTTTRASRSHIYPIKASSYSTYFSHRFHVPHTVPRVRKIATNRSNARVIFFFLFPVSKRNISKCV